MTHNPEEIDVVIAHPWGDIKTSLTDWMKYGPGLRRLVAPEAAYTKDGKRLPLSVIPLRYRNNLLSRLRIKIGWLENPWKHASSNRLSPDTSNSEKDGSLH